MSFVYRFSQLQISDAWFDNLALSMGFQISVNIQVVTFTVSNIMFALLT